MRFKNLSSKRRKKYMISPLPVESLLYSYNVLNTHISIGIDEKIRELLSA